MSERQRLSARDYKHAKRDSQGFDFARYQQLGIGLGIGLFVALGVWLYDHRAQPGTADALADVTKPETRTDKTTARQSAAADAEVDPATDYAFYDALPKSQMTIPEKEHAPHRDLPDQPVVQPGTYVLQVISYRNQADAERLVDKLGKLGITAAVQHVTIDTDEFYRVRIGPVSDLNKLNATRRQLRAADIDSAVYRVGD